MRGAGDGQDAGSHVNSHPPPTCSGPLRLDARRRGEGFEAALYGVECQRCRIYMELLNGVESARVPMVIVDESLKVKNAEAKRTRRILEVGKRAEWC